MSTNGAKTRSLLTKCNVSTVGTNPCLFFFPSEDHFIFNVLQKVEVASFVVLLNLGNHVHQRSNLVKPFLTSIFGKVDVHLCPLVVLAGSGVLEVLRSCRNLTAF